MALAINEETTLKQFIELVISALESNLILRLMNIRDELNSNAKLKAKKLLNELQESTFIHCNSTSTELQGAINQARTDLQAQFDKIIEWFVPSTSGNSTPYLIEDAMMVAEAIIKEANPFFKINVESDEKSAISIHGQLPIFVDIFINIFENVVKRSGLDSPEAEVNMWADDAIPDLQVIHFKIFNKLGSNIDIDLLDSELKRKKGLLQNDLYSQYLAAEGNSGLFKIHKSLRDFKVIGFEIKPTMDFGVENDIFQITISVPFRVFVLETDEQP